MWSEETSPKNPSCSQAVLGKFYGIEKRNQYKHELQNIKHQVNDNIMLHQLELESQIFFHCEQSTQYW